MIWLYVSLYVIIGFIITVLVVKSENSGETDFDLDEDGLTVILLWMMWPFIVLFCLLQILPSLVKYTIKLINKKSK